MAKKIVVLLIALAVVAGAAGAMEFAPGTKFLNVGAGIGTSVFSVEPNIGTTVTSDTAIAPGGAVSFEWLPSGKAGLSYGVETGFYYAGYSSGNMDGSAMAIPILFRLGWHPSFIKVENLDVYLLGKVGWTFGFWGGDIADIKPLASFGDDAAISSPSGLSFGGNIGAKYFITPSVGIFLEAGMNWYRLNTSASQSILTIVYYANIENYATLGVTYKFGGK